MTETKYVIERTNPDGTKEREFQIYDSAIDAFKDNVRRAHREHAKGCELRVVESSR